MSLNGLYRQFVTKLQRRKYDAHHEASICMLFGENSHYFGQEEQMSALKRYYNQWYSLKHKSMDTKIFQINKKYSQK